MGDYLARIPPDLGGAAVKYSLSLSLHECALNPIAGLSTFIAYFHCSTEGGVEASHGRDLATPKGPAPPRPNGMTAATSRLSSPAFTAPAAHTTTTFNGGHDVDNDSVQEVFDEMLTSLLPSSTKSLLSWLAYIFLGNNVRVCADGLQLRGYCTRLALRAVSVAARAAGVLTVLVLQSECLVREIPARFIALNQIEAGNSVIGSMIGEK